MTIDLNYQQLDRVAKNLKGKQDQIYYLHDEPRSHIAKSTDEKLLQLEWITVLHSSHSLDLTNGLPFVSFTL